MFGNPTTIVSRRHEFIARFVHSQQTPPLPLHPFARTFRMNTWPPGPGNLYNPHDRPWTATSCRLDLVVETGVAVRPGWKRSSRHCPWTQSTPATCVGSSAPPVKPDKGRPLTGEFERVRTNVTNMGSVTVCDILYFFFFGGEVLHDAPCFSFVPGSVFTFNH